MEVTVDRIAICVNEGVVDNAVRVVQIRKSFLLNMLVVNLR